MHIVCPHCLATNRVPEEKLTAHPNCGKCKQPLFTGKPIAASDANFRKLLGGDLPVIVDCWASWCGPCKMFAPVFEQAASQLEPRYRLLKLDTERHQQTAAQLGIRSIPTLIAFKGGREVKRMSGAMQSPQFLAWARQVS